MKFAKDAIRSHFPQLVRTTQLWNEPHEPVPYGSL